MRLQSNKSVTTLNRADATFVFTSVFGQLVIACREFMNAWRDIELIIPIDSELPPAGQLFSTSASASYFNILDISVKSLWIPAPGVTNLTSAI